MVFLQAEVDLFIAKEESYAIVERRFVRKWETEFGRDMQYVIYISPEDDKEKCKKKLPNYHCCGKETTKQCFFDTSPAPPPPPSLDPMFEKSPDLWTTD